MDDKLTSTQTQFKSSIKQVTERIHENNLLITDRMSKLENKLDIYFKELKEQVNKEEKPAK